MATVESSSPQRETMTTAVAEATALQLQNPPTAVPLHLALPPPPSTGSISTSVSQVAATAVVAAAGVGTATATPPTNPRRLPPPCWSHDETIALIDSYREKWYSLRRGNLKATHWQDVADAVGRRCPTASPPKTAVQCRHKMEKLRKRYRTEIQRARSMPLSRFSSSWVHFKRMDAMEKGPSVKRPDAYNSDLSAGDNDNDNDDDEDDEDDDQEYGYNNGSANTRNVHKLYRSNGIGSSSHSVGGGGLSGGAGCGGLSGGAGGGGSGFRIRIPTAVSIAQPGPKLYPKFDHKYSSPNPNFVVNSTPNSKPNINMGPAGGYGARVYDSGRSGSGSGSGKREREREPMVEMVAAIKMLGDGFVRMEQMKMEMAREIETMRMEMEMKRTEMILESQHRIVEAFAKAVSEKKSNKKPKRMPSPGS